MKIRALFLALVVFVSFCDGKIPQVKCESGVISGSYMTTRNGKTFSGFMGIPYAEPPIGDLRFKPPVPLPPFKGVFNATKIHPVCPQRDIYRRSNIFKGEEDCLYLNVYTPKIPTQDSDLLPVMVFFHGGGWLCGGGNSEWYGPDILLDRDVILVIPNYRLGALGFLSTGDEVVPGNNGLKDQNLALKWIQKNIESFGGDPKSVTLFGESAGGASVHYHMLSPMSKGLFSRGIAQSGTSQCIWAFAPKGESVDHSKKLAVTLNCPTNCSTQMVECLRRIGDPLDFVRNDVIFMEWDFDPMIPFKPTVEPNVEGAFLTEEPVTIIKAGKSAQVPFVVGVTSEDGGLRGAGVLGNPHLLTELDREFDKVVPISLMYQKTAADVSSVTKQIRQFYFGGDKVNASKSKEVVNMYTDGWFLNCADETAVLHKTYSQHPVYYYLFGYRGSASFSKIFGGGDTDYGVCHADDLQYLFPVGLDLFPDVKPNDDDIYVTELFTKLWTNFARTGEPTPDDSDETIREKWHPIQSDNMEYYYIDSKGSGMRNGLLLDRAKFWRQLNANPRLVENEIGKRDEL